MTTSTGLDVSAGDTPSRLLSFDVAGNSVSALLLRPPGARALFVVGHGAGAGMRHVFMEEIAVLLAERGVATLRYQFPYMELGRRYPNPQRVLTATARRAVAVADDAEPDLPLFAGGKSMGGRMTSLAAADAALPDVRGIVFLGFPLHGIGKPPGIERSEHLGQVEVPLLFVQGTRDRLANLDFLRPVVDRLGPRATLHVVEGGDHSFKVLKRSGRTHPEVMTEVADAVAGWVRAMAGQADEASS